MKAWELKVLPQRIHNGLSVHSLQACQPHACRYLPNLCPAQTHHWGIRQLLRRRTQTRALRAGQPRLCGAARPGGRSRGPSGTRGGPGHRQLPAAVGGAATGRGCGARRQSSRCCQPGAAGAGSDRPRQVPAGARSLCPAHDCSMGITEQRCCKLVPLLPVTSGLLTPGSQVPQKAPAGL